MDEHDDDLASEVIEGEEIETDSFEAAEDDDDVQSAEPSEEDEDEAPSEDESEI